MKIKDRKGVAAIEFAILLPLLIFLIFGAIEFGLFFYNKQVLTNASREGARAGIVAGTARLTDGEIGQVVDDYCANYLVTFGSATGLSVQIVPSGNRDSLSFGDDLTVTVSFRYTFLVLSNLGFGDIDLAAETLMKME